MPADAILVIDAGTSALRALAAAPGGRVTTIASEPWPMFVPDDAAPFGRELDPRSVAAALRLVLDAARLPGIAFAALAFTGQREGLTFLDGTGAAVLASPNIDARASAEGIAIDAGHASEVYAATGHLPSLMQAPAKLAWLRAHRPRDAERVAHVLPLVDWLAMLVAGGAPRMSRTLAAENGLLDVTHDALATVLLDALGLTPSLVPPCVADGTVVGEAAGAPVVLAGADTQCALIGMGAMRAGDAAVPAGWSAPVQLVTSSPVFDCEKRTWTSVHAAPAAWILESNAGDTGRAWDWICSMMGLTATAAEALAAVAPAGAADTMAVLGPRAMRASEMSAGMGALTLPLPLVMSSPDRGHLLRSVLEATAYAVRANLEQLEAVADRKIDVLRLGGGMSRSETFAHIVADVVDRPVEVAAAPETSALGAAALASHAAGLHPTLDAAVAAFAGGRRTVEPRAAASAEYEDYYARWCLLADEMQRLATEAG